MVGSSVDTITLLCTHNREGDTFKLAPQTITDLRITHGLDTNPCGRIFIARDPDVDPTNPWELNPAQQQTLVFILTRLPNHVTQGYRCEVREPVDDKLLAVWWG